MDNFYSKILKRDDGSQIKIEINLYCEYFRNTELRYDYTIFKRSKGKRKFVHIPSQIGGRLNKEILEVISSDEILKAETEFWNKIKPVAHMEL